LVPQISGEKHCRLSVQQAPVPSTPNWVQTKEVQLQKRSAQHSAEVAHPTPSGVQIGETTGTAAAPRPPSEIDAATRGAE
jgi:hypothetical protein